MSSPHVLVNEVKTTNCVGKALFGILGGASTLLMGLILLSFAYGTVSVNGTRVRLAADTSLIALVAAIHFLTSIFAFYCCSRRATATSNKITGVLLVLSSVSCHLLFETWMPFMVNHIIRAFMAYLMFLDPKDPKLTSLRPVTVKVYQAQAMPVTPQYYYAHSPAQHMAHSPVPTSTQA